MKYAWSVTITCLSSLESAGWTGPLVAYVFASDDSVSVIELTESFALSEDVVLERHKPATNSGALADSCVLPCRY